MKGNSSKGQRWKQDDYVALAMAMALLLAVPSALNFNLNLWQSGPVAGPTVLPMSLARPLAWLGGLLSLVVAILPLWLCCTAWRAQRKSGASKRITTIALIVSTIALLQWMFIVFDLWIIIEAFNQYLASGSGVPWR